MKWLWRFFVRRPVVSLTLLLFTCEGLAIGYFLLTPMLTAEKSESDAEGDTSPTELPLGEFKVRNHQTPSDSIILKFSVCLIVSKDHMESVESSFKQHQNRVREGIAIVARRANEKILAEDALPTLKRRIKVAFAGAIEANIDTESIDVLLPDFVIQKG